MSHLYLHWWCISINVASQMHACCISNESLLHLMRISIPPQRHFWSSSQNFWSLQMHPGSIFSWRASFVHPWHISFASLTISNGYPTHFPQQCISDASEDASQLHLFSISNVCLVHVGYFASLAHLWCVSGASQMCPVESQEHLRGTASTSLVNLQSILIHLWISESSLARLS